MFFAPRISWTRCGCGEEEQKLEQEEEQDLKRQRGGATNETPTGHSLGIQFRDLCAAAAVAWQLTVSAPRPVRRPLESQDSGSRAAFRAFEEAAAASWRAPRQAPSTDTMHGPRHARLEMDLFAG